MPEKTNKQRINNIIGQLNGVSKMLDSDHNCCEDLLIQIKSIKSSVSSLMNKIIEEELNNCISSKKLDKDKFKKLLKNINN